MNAGQYMVYAKSLLDMMQSDEMSVWKVKNKKVDDQQQLAKWYIRNKDTTQFELDIESFVFRNLMTGLVDSRPGAPESKPNVFTCGHGDAVRNCSRFISPFWGSANPSTLIIYIEMVAVPNCSTSENPFSLHGAGPTKKGCQKLVDTLQSEYEKLITSE